MFSIFTIEVTVKISCAFKSFYLLKLQKKTFTSWTFFVELSPDDKSFTQPGPLIGGSVAAILVLLTLIVIIIITLGKRLWRKEKKNGEPALP